MPWKEASRLHQQAGVLLALGSSRETIIYDLMIIDGATILRTITRSMQINFKTFNLIME